MRVELNVPEPVTEPRLWVKHQPVLAMALGLGSIEVGSRRSEMRRLRFDASEMNHAALFVAPEVISLKSEWFLSGKEMPLRCAGIRAGDNDCSSCRRVVCSRPTLQRQQRFASRQWQ